MVTAPVILKEIEKMFKNKKNRNKKNKKFPSNSMTLWFSAAGIDNRLKRGGGLENWFENKTGDIKVQSICRSIKKEV